LDDSAVREQIQRILDSELFRSSELQRRLFKYLAERSLAGEADDLKEYSVGVDALGKPATYDPQRDSTVRLQSGRLRQKLLEYYITQGQADPVLVDFPRGRFKLVFSPREPSATLVSERAASKWRHVSLALAGVVALMAALCLYFGISLSLLKHDYSVVADVWQPALTEFWKPFLTDKNPPLICMGAPMLVRQMPLIIRQPGTDTWEDAVKSGLIERLKRAFPDKEAPRPWYIFTGMGEAQGVFLLGRLFGARVPDLHFVNTLTLTWNEIGENNVVFVGPTKFNLQIQELPAKQDLIVAGPGIVNLRPQPGEAASIEDGVQNERGDNGETYALITCLPGLHGRGNILILAGPWTEGTLAAVEYVTEEPYARELLAHLRLPSGQLPRYFQVLIHAKYRNWVPVEVTYVLHHVLKISEPAGRGAR
jgi:hypothetical protein